jgi:arabinofuranosyltransferase
VQAYTHPLWLVVVGAAYGITREPYATTMGISLACSMATIAVATRGIVSSTSAAVACLALFAGSRAFIEYSTSGLENPLTHLLTLM